MGMSVFGNLHRPVVGNVRRQLGDRQTPYWTTLKLPLVVVNNRCTAGPRFSPFLSYNFFTTKTKTVRDSDAGIRRTGSPYRRCVGLMRTRCGSVCIRFAANFLKMSFLIMGLQSQACLRPEISCKEIGPCVKSQKQQSAKNVQRL